MITLTQLTEMAKSLVDVDEAVKKSEQVTKELKAKALEIKEVTIPCAMQELGVTRYDLESGQTITLKQEVYASIPIANKTEAYGWLEEHGLSQIIKSTVTTLFDRGELTEAGQFFDSLQCKGMNVEFKENVHPTTLRATIKEEMRHGRPFPMELFGARAVDIAVVK